MNEDTKDLMRKIIMLLSEVRQQETERYENHVRFMSDITRRIEAFTDVVNDRWKKIEDNLEDLSSALIVKMEDIKRKASGKP
jgi:hypothetical protein